MEVLPKRFGKYGLATHPEKTRLTRFGKPQKSVKGMPNPPRREKLNFLGFTHHWGRSRKGPWVVRRKTESGRFHASAEKYHGVGVGEIAIGRFVINSASSGSSSKGTIRTTELLETSGALQRFLHEARRI
jgi:hypothetical protein